MFYQPIAKIAIYLLLGNLSQASPYKCLRTFLPELPLAQLQPLMTVDSFADHQKKIEALSLQLLLANLDILKQHKYIHSTIKVTGSEILENKPGPFKLIRIDFTDAFNSYSFNVRSNGNIVFLDKSFQFRTDNKVNNYRSIIKKMNGFDSIEQTELILASLPDTVVLSRVLSEAERLAWLNGDFRSSNHGYKVHFGLNNYHFRNQEPYRIDFTKEELFDFYDQGLLEINTYDSLGLLAPSPSARTSYGLEIEFVFVGPKSIEILKEKMQESLSR